jgi:putative hemolysin
VSSLTLSLAAIALCVLAEGFFSGSEMAIVSARWARLKLEAERGDHRAALLLWLWRNPDRLLATTLVGTNLAVITASVLTTSLAVRLVRDGTGLLAALTGREEILVTLCLTPLTLLLGEVIPKSVFRTTSDRMARRVVYPMALAWLVLYPLTTVLTFFSGLLKKAVRSRVEASPFVTREELALLVRLRDLKTELKRHERRMIRRLFTFRETLVREIMVPLVRVAAHEEGTTLGEALATFDRLKFTRYPVYRKRMFNIVGVFNVLSALHEPNLGKRVGRLVEPPWFVPESKSVVDLLREMERQRIRMAVVVDEYGGSVGIVTLEDVLEEIVGELEDEYAIKKSGIQRIDAATFEMDAHLSLESVAEKLGVVFPAGDYETLAGLMTSTLGRIPRQGETVKAGEVTMTALEASPRTVDKVRLATGGQQ